MKKKILVLALLLIFTSCMKTENKEKAENVPKKTETGQIENEKEINKSEEKEDFVLLKDNTDEKDILYSGDISVEYSCEGDYISQSKEAEAIIIAKVEGKGEGRKLTRGALIFTPIKVEVLDVLKGDKNRDFSTIEQIGGVTTARNYRDLNFETSNEKMGLDKLSDEELDNKYIASYPEAFKELKKGGVYVFYLGDPENEKENFIIQMDAYSILSLDENYEESKQVASKIREEGKAAYESEDIYFKGEVDGKVSLKDIIKAAKE